MQEHVIKGQPASRRAHQARTALITFLIVLALGSCGLYSLIFSERNTTHRFVLVLGLLSVPAISSVVARVQQSEGLRDISFQFIWRIGGNPLAFGWLVPIIVGFVAYGAAWGFGLARYAPPSVEGVSVAYLGAGSHVRFAVLLLISVTFFATIDLPLAAVGEIGWRGFVLLRLIDIDVPHPLLVTGLINGLWEAPLVLSGDVAPGPKPVLSALVFVVVIVAFSYVAGRLRLQSGSIWPSIVFHSSWNATVGGAFATATAGHSLWVGQAGICIALTLTATAIIFARGWWPARMHPDDDEPRNVRGWAM